MSENDEIAYAFYDQMHDRLSRIEEKIDAIQEFKATTIYTARLTSFVVSGILGFVSLVTSGIVTYLITIKIGGK